MSNTDPNIFEGEHTRNTLYAAQRRYHNVVIGLFFTMVVINLAFVIAITIFEVQARNGRELIADCISPKGRCSQQATENARQRGAAIVYCQKNLPAGAQRDIVLECIMQNSGGR